VYRVDLPHRAFFVKQYRCPTLLDAARRLFRASASQREYRRAVEVSRRRVPTATPVAVGERLRHGIVRENLLITEAIPGACSLQEYVAERLPQLPAPQRAVVRRKLIDALARLCAAAHRAGVDHNDLHAGNVLIQPDSCRGDRDDPQLPELHLIDLAGARLSRGLGWRRSRDSLVMLGASWARHASRSDLWRFWRAYLGQRPELRLADPRRAVAELMERIGRRRRRVARGRDRRSLRVNRDFYRIAAPAASGHAVADFPRHEFERLLADPNRPLQAGALRPLKLAHRSVVVQTELRLAEGSVRVAYKRVRAKNWRKALAFFLGRSPAMDAWYLGQALLLRGLPTARPLVVCETRKFGLRGDSYLATQWIDGAINLHLFGWKLARLPAAERRLRTRQAAVVLGRLVGRMHAWQISHPDLKGCNLLLAQRAEGLEAFLIDLDGVRLARRLWPWTRARNLGRLATSIEAHPWVTRTDRLRFLRAYLREAFPSRPCDWKRLWRSAGAASLAMTRRLKRRGRPVV
jgi:tRNA A-37 threonylcarbamoyl transferase component Bud32